MRKSHHIFLGAENCPHLNFIFRLTTLQLEFEFKWLLFSMKSQKSRKITNIVINFSNIVFL